ncbi:MAG: helicase-exonuclease AddAB subunit AddA [Lachnospiraceae bacterium]|nr:helicase-exonuclease AddAB subunit AddA [Lachnospiraceae bacterium]
MGVSYTADQQKVIDTRGKNILVSAAAGSGKTAVLVERIVQLVCDSDHPVDIDRLLIVTFTNAAAAEMRERISDALSKRLQSRPENDHLQRQLTLLHNAQITTIDSFCLFVIRNNFNDIGLDPGFRVADEGELKLLKKEVMERMLEEYYAAGDEEYLRCVESFSEKGSEKPLAEQIESLCAFAESYPWPEEWLQQAADAYAVADGACEPEDPGTGAGECLGDKATVPEWLAFAERDIRQTVEGCRQRLGEALKLCEESDGPYMYGELLEKECEMLSRVETAEHFEMLGEQLGGVMFGRLPSKKDDTVSVQKRELAKYMRGQVKDTLQKLRDRYFFLPYKVMSQDLCESGRIVRKVVSMSLDFRERFRQKKQEKNLIDFGDMEHYALNILLEKTEEGYVPSRAARDYRAYFYEILIDEYQDSNLVQEYLLQSISGEAVGTYNRFMVGDVKQSIYKFRLARPEIFMEKLKSYTEQDDRKMRITLKQNFRSRRQVLDCVNAVFYRIMREDFGGIEYDDDAALYPGAVYPEYDSCTSQLILLERDQQSKASKTEQEAELAAAQIEKLMGGYRVTDKETGMLRNVRYGDIAILVRTNAGWEEELRKALGRHGIPAYSSSSTGYFSSEEIRRVMSFLRILDNPLQDIPMYGVLVSPMGGFTEEEIARIRADHKQVSLYEALLAWRTDVKVEAFLNLYDKLRALVSNTPVRRLIREILEETGYYRYITAFPDGVKRKGNLEMLLKKAADFESTSYYGLFHFIRYMEQLEKYDVDYGEANVLDENADVVRIMSIHKSKGLEFPVCIVAGLSKRFNIRSEAGMFLTDIDLGIGCEAVDPERRIRRTTLRRNVLARKQRLDNLGEELRILYVAMTRAREKLILTACVDDIDRKLTECMSEADGGESKLSYLTLQDAGCMLDFLLPAWLAGQRECSDMELIRMHSKDIVREELQSDISGNLRRERLLAGNYPVDERMEDEMCGRLSYEYPHKNLEQLYTKTTVSELKLERMVELSEPVNQMFDTQIRKAYVPRFAGQIQELSGSSRGNAYHRVMELLRLDIPAGTDGGAQAEILAKEEITSQIRGFAAEGKMPEEYVSCVSEDKLLRFLNTPEACRMREADEQGLLYREQPFVLGLPAKEVKEEFPEGETVLIQGIIDVFWEEEDGITVLDYKTDRVRESQELIRRYQAQLDWYGEALFRLTGKPVTEKLIYSFCLNEIIRL